MPKEWLVHEILVHEILVHTKGVYVHAGNKKMQRWMPSTVWPKLGAAVDVCAIDGSLQPRTKQRSL